MGVCCCLALKLCYMRLMTAGYVQLSNEIFTHVITVLTLVITVGEMGKRLVGSSGG